MYLDWQDYSIRKIATGYGLKSNTYIQCNVWWSQDSLQAPILLLHHRMDTGNHYWSGLAIVIPTCCTEQKLKCSSMRSAQHTMGVRRSTLLQAFSTRFQCTAQKCDFRNVGSRTQHAIKMGNVWTIYYPSCFWVLFSVTLVTLRPYCFVCFVLLGGVRHSLESTNNGRGHNHYQAIGECFEIPAPSLSVHFLSDIFLLTLEKLLKIKSDQFRLVRH